MGQHVHDGDAVAAAMNQHRVAFDGRGLRVIVELPSQASGKLDERGYVRRRCAPPAGQQLMQRRAAQLLGPPLGRPGQDRAKAGELDQHAATTPLSRSRMHETISSIPCPAIACTTTSSAPLRSRTRSKASCVSASDERPISTAPISLRCAITEPSDLIATGQPISVAAATASTAEPTATVLASTRPRES